MGIFETYTQGNRLLQIDSPLGGNTLLLTKIEGSDSLSNPFEFTLTCLSEEPSLPAQELVGQALDFGFELNNGATRYFNGYVSRLVSLGTASEFLYRYQLTIVPKLWFLSRKVNLRIFQHQTLPQIVEQLLGEHEVVFENRLTASYNRHDYCVQYRESDLAFISRLLEESGIFYYFEHNQGEHKLILADNKSSYPACAQPLVAQSYGSLDDEHIHDWQKEVVFPHGQYSARSYNFESPNDDLGTNSQAQSGFPNIEPYEIYDYPGEYYDSGAGEPEAQVRMQEAEQYHQVVKASSSCRGLSVGGTFTVSIHDDRAEMGQSYLITAMNYTAEDDTYLNNDDPKQEISNRFTCIPKAVQFRPTRRHQKPSVKGVQSAIVTGPKGEEIYTDEYGRVKVQFHWDREGQHDENSSCWVRVSQQWAGAGFGGINIPRIGHEVLIEFEDGDPDRPIITGRVYNGNNPVPYNLPTNKTQSGWMSRSTPEGSVDNCNQIRFEDRKGAEQLLIHAEKNQDIEVENDESHWVGNNRSKVIDNDETNHIKHDRKKTVSNDEMVEIGNDRKTKIGNDVELKVGRNSQVEITKDLLENVNNHRKEYTYANHWEEVGGHYEHKVKGKYDLEVVEKITTKTGVHKIEVKDKITIAVNGGHIILDDKGITIEGKNVDLKGAKIDFSKANPSNSLDLSGKANVGEKFADFAEEMDLDTEGMKFKPGDYGLSDGIISVSASSVSPTTPLLLRDLMNTLDSELGKDLQDLARAHKLYKKHKNDNIPFTRTNLANIYKSRGFINDREYTAIVNDHDGFAIDIITMQVRNEKLVSFINKELMPALEDAATDYYVGLTKGMAKHIIFDYSRRYYNTTPAQEVAADILEEFSAYNIPSE
jgi:type VI secretion system secreted protein VgrG